MVIKDKVRRIKEPILHQLSVREWVKSENEMILISIIPLRKMLIINEQKLFQNFKRRAN